MHNKTSCLQKVAILLWLLPAFWWGWVLPCLLLPICFPHLSGSLPFLSASQNWLTGTWLRLQDASGWRKFTPLHFLAAFDNRGRRTCIYEHVLLFEKWKDCIGNCYASEQVLITILLKKICNSTVMLEDSTWTSINLWLGQYLQSALYIELVCFLTYQGFSFNWVILTQIGRELRHMTIGGLQQSVRKVMLLSNIEQLKN